MKISLLKEINKINKFFNLFFLLLLGKNDDGTLEFINQNLLRQKWALNQALV